MRTTRASKQQTNEQTKKQTIELHGLIAQFDVIA
jgi:hypothetical protein